VSLPDPIAPAIRPAEPAVSRLEGGRGGPDVETLAREFEAMLLLQMVRQLRQSFLDEGAGGDGLGAETMTDTFDVEFARYLSAAGGVGLARLLAAHVDVGEAALAAEGEPGAPDTGATRALGSPGVDATRAGSAPAETGRHGHGDEAPDAALQPVASRRPGAGAVPRAGTPVAPVGIATPVASQEASAGAGVDGTAPAGDRLAMPLAPDVTSAFGWRADPFHGGARFHGGIDLRAAYGREVPVAAPGRVVFAGEQGSYGQTVVVEHPGGYRTRYAHLSAIAVRPGEELASGAVVGRVGQSGRATGPHLHFEVWRGSERVDPLAVAAVWPGLKPLAMGVDFPIDGDRARTPSTGADHED
jgi:murein DD-endopeptidase MepM/ murein hydrolase activator NlpD